MIINVFEVKKQNGTLFILFISPNNVNISKKFLKIPDIRENQIKSDF